jgi:hypothetical protein
MASESPEAQKSGDKAAVLCQRVEDNAFHLPKKKGKKSLQCICAFNKPKGQNHERETAKSISASSG